MSLKVGIQRRTGAEETMIVEVVGNTQVIERELQVAYRIMDARAWVMFARTAEGQASLRKLGAENPQMYLAMQEAMRFLFEGDVKAPANVEQYAPPTGTAIPGAEVPAEPEPKAEEPAA